MSRENTIVKGDNGKHYTSASMFPAVMKHMFTAIQNHDLSADELGTVKEYCRDMIGTINVELERMAAKHQQPEREM